MADTLIDLPFGGVQPATDGAPRLRRPFINAPVPDRTALIIERDYRQTLANYEPGNIGVETDPVYSTAYLCLETDPVPGAAEVGKFTRTYARIPGDQVTPDAKLFQPPSINDTFIASTAWGVSFENDTQNYVFTTRKSVSAIGAINATTNLRAIGSAAHGLSAGIDVVVWNNDRIVGTIRVESVTTDNLVIRAVTDPWTTGTLIATHVQSRALASAAYDNTPRTVSVRRTQKFYLPGISAGITTFADIPLQTPATTAQGWLAALVAGTAFVVDSTDQLAPWLGPILVYGYSEIQMSDAKVAITP